MVAGGVNVLFLPVLMVAGKNTIAFYFGTESTNKRNEMNVRPLNRIASNGFELHSQVLQMRLLR